MNTHLVMYNLDEFNKKISTVNSSSFARHFLILGQISNVKIELAELKTLVRLDNSALNITAIISPIAPCGIICITRYGCTKSRYLDALFNKRWDENMVVRINKK